MPATPLSPPVPGDLRVTLQGRLARLEPLRADHEDGLIAAACDPEMFGWMPVDMASVPALRQWLETALASAAADREIPYAIVSAQTGTVLGSTRFLEIRLEHLRAEIGWTWVTRPAWSSGVNAECKLMLLSHALETVGLRRVEFKTDARNERSRGALHAAGATFEGILRKHMVVRDGGERDSAYYSVIDDDWPRVKAHLRQRVDGLAGG